MTEAQQAKRHQQAGNGVEKHRTKISGHITTQLGMIKAYRWER